MRPCEHAGGCIFNDGKPVFGTVAVRITAPGDLTEDDQRWRLVCEDHARKYALFALLHGEISFFAMRLMRPD